MQRHLTAVGIGLALVICGCGSDDESFGGSNNLSATGMVISAQPSTGTPNVILNNFQVAYVNGNGIVPTQGPITLTLSSNPTGAVLGGTTSGSTGFNGVIDFNNLTISKKGVYRITASSPGVAPVVSNPIVIGGGSVNVVKTASIANPAAVTGGIFSVHSADLNGDGNLDIVSSFFDDSLISIYLGSANGTFSAPTNLTTTMNPQDFTIGDFNGDGKADLAVPSSFFDTMMIYLGQGNGSFAAPTSVAVGVTPVDAATGDFNGDGKADLVTANFDGGNITVLLGNGTGGFPTVTPLALTAGVFANTPSKILVADFNGDGKADIAVADGSDSAVSNNQAQVFPGTGTGTFGAPTVLNTGNFPRGLAAADFSGDGKVDLATANRNSNNLTIFINNGAGFAAGVPQAAGVNPNKVSAADLNLDGKIDLINTNSNGGSASIHLGNGNGTFAAATTVLTSTAQPTGLDVGDYNKDSVPDFSIGNFSPFVLDIFLQTP